MEQINLSDYLNLSKDRILKIRLKKENEFIYGTIVSAYMLTKPTDNPVNTGVSGEFNKIIDFNNYKKDKSTKEDFTRLVLTTSEIESIEIIKM